MAWNDHLFAVFSSPRDGPITSALTALAGARPPDHVAPTACALVTCLLAPAGCVVLDRWFGGGLSGVGEELT
jgi:glucose/mannose transport system permease protein